MAYKSFSESKRTETLDETARNIAKEISYGDLENGFCGIPPMNPRLIKRILSESRIDSSLLMRAVHYGICDGVRMRYNSLIKQGRDLTEHNLGLSEPLLAYAFKEGGFSQQELKLIHFDYGLPPKEFIKQHYLDNILLSIACSLTTPPPQEKELRHWDYDGPCTC